MPTPLLLIAVRIVFTMAVLIPAGVVGWQLVTGVIRIELFQAMSRAVVDSQPDSFI